MLNHEAECFVPNDINIGNAAPSKKDTVNSVLNTSHSSEQRNLVDRDDFESSIISSSPSPCNISTPQLSTCSDSEDRIYIDAPCIPEFSTPGSSTTHVLDISDDVPCSYPQNDVFVISDDDPNMLLR